MLICPAHQEAPVKREVRRWTGSEVTLHDALDDVDWGVFQTTTENIDEFAETVISYIGVLVDTIIPTTTIRNHGSTRLFAQLELADNLNGFQWLQPQCILRRLQSWQVGALHPPPLLNWHH